MFDQVRAIRKNGWLSKLKLEVIKVQVEDESHGELRREQDVTVEGGTVKTDVVTVEEKMNDSVVSIG